MGNPGLLSPGGLPHTGCDKPSLPAPGAASSPTWSCGTADCARREDRIRWRQGQREQGRAGRNQNLVRA